MMWVVSESGVKLPDELCRQGVCSSNKQARKLIDQGACSVNGLVVRFANHVMRKHDRISVVKPCLQEIQILYEDAFFFAINKPAGLASHQEDLCKALHRTDIHLVHRLDKYTSGVLLIAKNHAVEKSLLQMFKDHLIHKHYVAFVQGSLSHEQTISLPVEEKDRRAQQVLWGIAAPGRGKQAVTHVVPIIVSRQASFVSLFPKTGRTHQLRVHMAAIGHPIVGDFVYGKASSYPYYTLHCKEVSFYHPSTTSMCTIQAELPAFIQDVGLSIFKKDGWLIN